MKIDALVLSERDNVATALRDIRRGEEASVGCLERVVRIQIDGDIPFGHKFAVRHVSAGAEIFKHGEVIGRATSDIEVGTHAHVHNIESLRGRGDWSDGKGN